MKEENAMKKEKTRLLVRGILFGLSAAAWLADCADAMSHGHTGLGWLLLIAAAVFFAAFIATLRRYLSGRRVQEE